MTASQQIKRSARIDFILLNERPLRHLVIAHDQTYVPPHLSTSRCKSRQPYPP